MSKKRILLVEDETDMAELAALRLKREGYQVEVCHDGAEGWRRVQTEPPDLVLLDIMLPGMNGVEVLRQMRNNPRLARTPVIMLTARTEDADVIVGLQTGADDYVTKPFSMSVLVARVSAMLRRAQPMGTGNGALLSAGPINIDTQQHRVTVNDKEVSLTLTEFRLLSAIIAARGRVLNRNQLIDHALGQDAIVTDRTIDVHLTALRRKLGDARHLIETVRGLGYRLALPENEKV
ncbi:MAG: response regulator transcription factor [Sedimentisphaerales bacterium]|nr:response regulator transcription factor [Sedimentisphaerales bacterium]